MGDSSTIFYFIVIWCYKNDMMTKLILTLQLENNIEEIVRWLVLYKFSKNYFGIWIIPLLLMFSGANLPF